MKPLYVPTVRVSQVVLRNATRVGGPHAADNSADRLIGWDRAKYGSTRKKGPAPGTAPDTSAAGAALRDPGERNLNPERLYAVSVIRWWIA